jgi:putative Mg2+ transporter-C (MgtC) family protein
LDWIGAWFGDIHQIPYLTFYEAGLISIAMAAVCGAIVGLEREKREKPAGLRTLILICVGCAIFTLASLLIAGPQSDRGRIASNVVPGIGFLGAGAIIHERRAVVGLTTAATIWSVAGIGIIVGIGYGAVGVVLAFFIFIILTFLRVLERSMYGPCHRVIAQFHFRPDRGKSRQRLQAVLDGHHVQQSSYRFATRTGVPPGEPPTDVLEITYCPIHRAHRAFVSDLVSLPEVEALEEGERIEDHAHQHA